MAPQQGVDPALANFLEEEKRKAMFNEVVSKLVDVCFDKCVTKPSRCALTPSATNPSLTLSFFNTAHVSTVNLNPANLSCGLCGCER